MPKPTKWPSAFWQANDTPFAAHVQIAGQDIQQSGLSAASYTVTYSDGTVEANAVSLTIDDVIFNTLQTGPGWTQDNAGYNLLVTIPAACFPHAGDYVVTIWLTPTAGTPICAAYFLHHANSTN